MSVTRNYITLQMGRPQGNLRAHRRWFDFLASEQFYEQLKKRYEQKKNLTALRRTSRAIVTADIYDAYSPEYYERTDALLNSMVAQPLGKSTAGIAVLSSLEDNSGGSPLAISGSSAGRFSYAAFFESSEYKSFIPVHAQPIRPFFADLTEAVTDQAPQMAQDALFNTMVSRMPR